MSKTPLIPKHSYVKNEMSVTQNTGERDTKELI